MLHLSMDGPQISFILSSSSRAGVSVMLVVLVVSSVVLSAKW